MFKSIVGSFIGTFFAMALVGFVAVQAIDSTVDGVVNQISEKIEARRTELVAFGGCVAQHIEDGETAAVAVERCMKD